MTAPSHIVVLHLLIIMVAEVLGVWLIGTATFHGYAKSGLQEAGNGIYESSLALLAILTLLGFSLGGAYQFPSRGTQRLPGGRALLCWFGVVAFFLMTIYLLKITGIYSRVWFTVLILGGGAWIIVVRLPIQRMVIRWLGIENQRKRVACIGTPDLLARMAERVRLHPHGDLSLVGTYVFDEVDTVLADGEPLHGGYKTARGLIRTSAIDEVLLGFDPSDGEKLARCVADLRTEPVNLRYFISGPFDELPIIGQSTIAGSPVLHLADRPLGGWNGVLKAIEDYVLATVFLLLASPLMLLIAIAIKVIHGGPVLFRQRRSGFNNNEFTVYKFRTMRADDDGDDVPQAQTGDPRLTGLGAFLRRTSLDELPQIVNVLRGHMSIVGPRPHAVAHNREYEAIIDGYLSRHRVKPGITGWAQVNGLRGRTDTVDKMRERVAHDIHYIDNWSIAFDLKILFMTIGVVLSGENAA